MQPFRIASKLPVTSVKTYSLAAPIPTHYRPASCAEARCPNHEFGWRTVIDESTELGRAQAHYIERESGRKFVREIGRTHTEAPDTGLATYTFEAGQKCFTQHQVSLDREPLYVVRDGDWRGNPTGAIRQHVNGDEWVEDFGEHQLKLADRMEQG